MKKLLIISLFMFNLSTYPMEGTPRLPPLVPDMELQEESQECSFAHMPDEVLLNLIEQMIPEQQIINLLDIVNQRIYNSMDSRRRLVNRLMTVELRENLRNLFNEYSKTLLQLNQFSLINKQIYSLMSDHSDIVSDLLRKKLHIFFDLKHPGVFNEYQTNLIPAWLLTLKSKLNMFSLPMQKIIKRLSDEIEIILKVSLNHYDLSYITTLLDNNDFNPDNIMIGSFLTGKNVRLLTFYLNSRVQHDPRMLRMLLYKGANPNFIKSKDNNSPLNLAINKKDLIAILLEKGADANTIEGHYEYDKKMPIIMRSIQEAHNNLNKSEDTRTQEVVTLLLEHNANPNSSIPPQKGSGSKYDRTPLSFAIDLYKKRPNLSLAIIELLLNAGANVNKINQFNKTMFDFALETDNQAIFELLLKKGNINIPDQSGKTLLIKFAQQADKTIVSELVNNGAKIDTQDNEGLTALMHAALNSHKNVVEFLLSQKNIHPSLKNNAGETALDIARRYGQDDLADFIAATIKKNEGTYYTSLLQGN